MAITEQKRRRAESRAMPERFLIRDKSRADRLFSCPGRLVSRITANTAIKTNAKTRAPPLRIPPNRMAVWAAAVSYTHLDVYKRQTGINQTRNAHVITLEDPIEYLHHHQRAVVTQREIGHDTASYVDGLRASLRQAPDVILLGEMRDYETIQTAMTAAETGHLLISTLHTTGAANTIDRIIDVFPADGQQQIRVQLAMVLKAVVSPVSYTHLPRHVYKPGSVWKLESRI